MSGHRVTYEEALAPVPWWKLAIAFPAGWLGFDRVVDWCLSYSVKAPVTPTQSERQPR